MKVDLTARMCSAKEFFEVYREGDEKQLYDGKSLLMWAIGNTKAEARYEICNFLLDKSVVGIELKGIGGANLLHVLLDQYQHNIPKTTALCKRLLDAGLNPNERNLDGVSAVEYLVKITMGRVKEEEEKELHELLDLFFSLPYPLDFNTPSGYGAPPTSFLKARIAPSIVERIEEYAKNH